MDQKYASAAVYSKYVTTTVFNKYVTTVVTSKDVNIAANKIKTNAKSVPEQPRM